MEVYAPNPAQVGGKEKQMPDWGPINDSKSATYLLAYVYTRWISNSAGIKLKQRKGQIGYWQKGSAERLGLETF